MDPHKLYPLYLLAKLYDETGQDEKARKVSNHVLDKKKKVKSRATEEIREEVRKVINKSNIRRQCPNFHETHFQ